jgi:hypothetical protein
MPLPPCGGLGRRGRGSPRGPWGSPRRRRPGSRGRPGGRPGGGPCGWCRAWSPGPGSLPLPGPRRSPARPVVHPRAPTRLHQAVVEGLHEEGVRAQRGCHARACRGLGRHLGDVLLDVVAAGQEEGDQDGFRGARVRARVSWRRGSLSSMWPRWTGRPGRSSRTRAMRARTVLRARGSRLPWATRTRAGGAGGTGRLVPFRETRLSWSASWLLIRFMMMRRTVEGRSGTRREEWFDAVME